MQLVYEDRNFCLFYVLLYLWGLEHSICSILFVDVGMNEHIVPAFMHSASSTNNVLIKMF